MILPNWAAVILVFGAVIFIHELGHFLVAKRAGIRVHEFAIGFGPAFAAWKRGDTRYTLRLLPFGGFVRMAGMEPGDLDDPQGFNSKRLGWRAGVISAGPLMNLVLAGVLLAAHISVVGLPQEPLVGRVEPGSPAHQAGFLSGDRIVRVNGETVQDWLHLVRLVRASGGQHLEVDVLRGGQTVRVSVTPAVEEGRGRLGIEPVYQPVPFWRALPMGFERMGQMIVYMIAALKAMITGVVQPDFAGPVGITMVIANANRAGLANLLQVAAFLNINVAILNLLPIPALDGSRLMFLGIELVRGRPIDPRRESMVHLIGFIALLLLTFAITYSEIVQMFISPAPG